MKRWVKFDANGDVASTLQSTNDDPVLGYEEILDAATFAACEARTLKKDGTGDLVPKALEKVVDPRTFLRLFTAVERKAIRLAAKTDPDVEDWMALAHVPVPIRLAHPDTTAGLSLLVTKQLLTDARKAQILAGEVP